MYFLEKFSPIHERKNLNHKTQISSWRSYASFLTKFTGRKKSGMEKRLIHLLNQSSFCKSNPTLKYLFIQNVQMCCILVQASGGRSRKLICMSAPYFRYLLSKANPEIKSVLDEINGETLLPYFDLIDQTEWESLMPYVREAGTVLARGAKLSTQEVFDGSCTLEDAVSSVTRMAIRGSVAVFRILSENVIPSVQYLCTKNHLVRQFVLETLPTVILTVIKSVILFNILICKIILAMVSFSKEIFAFLRLVSDEIASDPASSSALQELCAFLRSLVSNDNLSKMFHTLSVTIRTLMSLFKKYGVSGFQNTFHILRTATPEVCKLIHNVITVVIPKLASMAENNLEYSVNVTYETICTLYKYAIRSGPMFYRLYKILEVVGMWFCNVAPPMMPYLVKFCKQFLIYAVKLGPIFLKLCNISQKGLVYVCFKLYEAYPLLYLLFMYIGSILICTVKCINSVMSELQPLLVPASKEVLTCFWKAFCEVSPVLYAAEREVLGTLFEASLEVGSKSYLAIKRISPSLLLAFRTVSPQLLTALNEVFESAYCASSVTVPVLYDAALVVYPEALKASSIVISDINKACIEVEVTSVKALRSLLPILKTVVCKTPLLLHAFNGVVATVFSLSSEAFIVSVNANLYLSQKLNSVCTSSNTDVVISDGVKQPESLMISEDVQECNSFQPVVKYEENELEELLKLRKQSNSLQLSSVVTPTQTCVRAVVTSQVHFCGRVLSLSHGAVNTIMKRGMVYQKALTSFLISYESYVPDYVYSAFPNLTLSHTVDLWSKPVSRAVSLAYKEILMFKDVLIESNLLPGVRSEFIALACSSVTALYRYNCQISRCTWVKVCRYTPGAWYFIKDTVASSWKLTCDAAPELWLYLEDTSGVSWDLVCKFSPKAWKSFKEISRIAWITTCEVSPYIWRLVCTVTPVMYITLRNSICMGWGIHCKATSGTFRLICSYMSSDKWAKYMGYWNSLHQKWNRCRNIKSLSGWGVIQKTLSLSQCYLSNAIALSNIVSDKLTDMSSCMISTALNAANVLYSKSSLVYCSIQLSLELFSNVTVCTCNCKEKQCNVKAEKCSTEIYKSADSEVAPKLYSTKRNNFVRYSNLKRLVNLVYLKANVSMLHFKCLTNVKKRVSHTYSAFYSMTSSFGLLGVDNNFFDIS